MTSNEEDMIPRDIFVHDNDVLEILLTEEKRF